MNEDLETQQMNWEKKTQSFI